MPVERKLTPAPNSKANHSKAMMQSNGIQDCETRRIVYIHPLECRETGPDCDSIEISPCYLLKIVREHNDISNSDEEEVNEIVFEDEEDLTCDGASDRSSVSTWSESPSEESFSGNSTCEYSSSQASENSTSGESALELECSQDERTLKTKPAISPLILEKITALRQALCPDGCNDVQRLCKRSVKTCPGTITTTCNRNGSRILALKQKLAKHCNIEEDFICEPNSTSDNRRLEDTTSSNYCSNEGSKSGVKVVSVRDKQGKIHKLVHQKKLATDHVKWHVIDNADCEIEKSDHKIGSDGRLCNLLPENVCSHKIEKSVCEFDKPFGSDCAESQEAKSCSQTETPICSGEIETPLCSDEMSSSQENESCQETGSLIKQIELIEKSEQCVDKENQRLKDKCKITEDCKQTCFETESDTKCAKTEVCKQIFTDIESNRKCVIAENCKRETVGTQTSELNVNLPEETPVETAVEVAERLTRVLERNERRKRGLPPPPPPPPHTSYSILLHPLIDENGYDIRFLSPPPSPPKKIEAPKPQERVRMYLPIFDRPAPERINQHI